MRPRRAIAVLGMASVLAAACCGSAAAIDPNTTLLLSRPSGLGALPGPGDGPTSVGSKAISGDGRMIVFASGADDLGVTDTLTHVWVRDTLTDTTTLVDRAPGGGAPGDGLASAAAISGDGGTVCFVGNATNLVAGVTGFHVFVVTLSSGAIAVADRGAGGAVGNGAAARCALDTTGTRVVFDSRANDLVPGDTNASTDVFVRDLGTGSTTRVSVNSVGLQAPSGGRGGAISADGFSVAFDTPDPLVGGDTNAARDVYVRSIPGGTLVRASVGTGGVQANGDSFDGALDAAGNHVAFVSDAPNLELGADSNNSLDVFWRDLAGDTTTAVSRATGAGGALGDEDSAAPAISGDGLGVAFESAATNLGAGAPAENRLVYLRRLGTNETLLLSRASGAAGAPANGFAGTVSLGTAPTVAAWHSLGSNLAPDASGEFGAVFKRDLSGEPATTLVSRPSGTAPRSAAVNDAFLGPRAASADGRLVVFQSSADGIDPAAAGRHVHVFVRDVASNTTTLLSRGPGPSGAVANGDSSSPGISAGGTHAVFFSNATNLLDGITTPQVYVRDLATGDLQVASRANGPDGLPGVGVRGDQAPDVSADGRRVAFVADGPLVVLDTNMRSDVYVRDLAAGATLLVSVGASGASGDNDSLSPSLSDDGMRVAFSSRANDLLADIPVPGFRFHVYVRDLGAGTTVLADRDAADGAPGRGHARIPEISGAGNRVAFDADEALTEESIPSTGALYVRDLTTDTTLLAGREDGAQGTVATLSGSFSLSQDGTRVSFSAVVAPDTTQVYVRDLAAGATILASAADGNAALVANASSRGNALTAAGDCLAFDSSADNLVPSGYPTRDFSEAYLRCLPPTTTTTTLPPASRAPIAANTIVLRPGRLVKLVARRLPAITADPTLGGGALEVRGTTGSATYALPASGWKASGRRGPKGFDFEGAGCRVTLRRRRIKAVCRGDTGGLVLPEPGPLAVVLSVGADGAAYCAECGGRTAGKPARVFKRKRCAAPGTCP